MTLDVYRGRKTTMQQQQQQQQQQTLSQRCSLSLSLSLSISQAVLVCYGIRHLTRDVNNDVRTLNFRTDVTYAPPRKTPNDVKGRPLCDVKCQK